MFVMVTKRVVKHNTGATAKFAPRTTNAETLTVSGPFADRERAERAMLAALATHTCLSAQILDDAAVGALLRGGSWSGHDVYEMAREATRLLQEATNATPGN